nr:MAG TPA: hypothetical protein [Caudoviricetes sp.]
MRTRTVLSLETRGEGPDRGADRAGDRLTRFQGKVPTS